MAGVLFEDIFDVKDIDPEGKKFDRGELYLENKYFYGSSFFLTQTVLPSAFTLPFCEKKHKFSCTADSTVDGISRIPSNKERLNHSTN